jgi:hypothetical protein
LVLIANLLKSWFISPLTNCQGENHKRYWKYTFARKLFIIYVFDTVLGKRITSLLFSFFYLFLIKILLYWAYIVIFTKVLTIYHCWIHTLHPPSFSFILFFSYSWNSFNMSHFSIFIHEYIIFPLHSPSYILSLYLPLQLVPIPIRDQFYLPVLCFWKKKVIFVCLR